ncbi:MAG: threonine-phosphate decarboxylase CobD [Alphaproteobacteria bacterium]|nr:threonine-phosphate decarboxylase CobD [Alphaproteobacteria bacterium]
MDARARRLRHGGDLAAASERFGRPAEGWLDLSTGINPNPYPLPKLDAAAWTRLPQADAEDRLLAAARAAYGAADRAAIVAAPGTQALIQWLPRLKAAGRVAVIGPTYGEHAAAWQAAGHAVAEISDLGGGGAADVCVVVNPNNPDGRVLEPDALLALAERLAAQGGLLVVDEAFADVLPEVSLAPHTGAPGLIILRSFGKFFGLPGLRLGFALGPANLIESLRQALGPWAVSSAALEVGAQALLDRDWTERTRIKINDLSLKTDFLLEEFLCPVVGSAGLYRLVETARAPALYDHLGRRGILTRPFDEQPAWLRIGLPEDEAALARLAAALRAFPAP